MRSPSAGAVRFSSPRCASSYRAQIIRISERSARESPALGAEAEQEEQDETRNGQTNHQFDLPSLARVADCSPVRSNHRPDEPMLRIPTVPDSQRRSRFGEVDGYRDAIAHRTAVRAGDGQRYERTRGEGGTTAVSPFVMPRV